MRQLLVAGSVVLGLASALAAQPLVPRDMYQGGLRQDGNAITFCVWPDSPLYAFDRDLALALGDALLLEVTFHDVTEGDSMLLTFENELFINLSDHCDVAMGMSFAWNPLPDWLTISQPYYDAAFVALTADPDIGRLGDVAAGSRVGSVVFSPGDTAFVTFNMAQPADSRWSRLPYQSEEQLLAAVQSGQVEAGLLWGPALAAMAPLPEPLRVIATDPLQIAPQQLGLGMKRENTFLRDLIGDAIGQLQAAGVIETLAAEYGLNF